jgi:hypothetical protein
MPAFLRLALDVRVFFFVLVLVAFVVFVLVFVFFFRVCGPFRGTRVLGESAIGAVPPFRVRTTADWHRPLLPLRVPSLQRSAIPVFVGVIWNRLPCDCETGNDPAPGDLGLVGLQH